MKIVIDIPVGLKDVFEHRSVTALDVEEMRNAIKNSTPLPKGHGRLKDVDAFLSKVKADREHSAYLRSWTADDVLNALDNSYIPTIVEADKA